MQLIHARIKNFRSLKDISVKFGSHTALIGGNGAGKSSILKAIEKFYSTAKTLEIDDYFGRDQAEPVEIELTFSGLSQLENGQFGGRVREGNLTVTRVFDGSGSSGRYFGSVLQNPDFVGIRSQAAAAPKRDAYRLLRTSDPVYADLPQVQSAPAAEEAMREWETNNSEQLVLLPDDGQFFGFQNAGRGALQRHTSFVFIPAVRDASVDAADGRTSVIGRLLELLVRSAILQRNDIRQFKAEITERYQQLVAPANMPELGQLASRLTSDLQGLYSDAEVGLAWRDPGELPVPLPTADVSLSDDGFGGPVDRQGHGLQRAFIFTLLQHLARTSTAAAADQGEGVDDPEPVAAPLVPSLILAVEEPELYQHPTKQRHLAEVLRALSSAVLPGAEGRTQVMFGSHSPMFVSLAKADEIRLARRVGYNDTQFKQCELRSLDLESVASKLELGWRKPLGTYTADALIPRLHILGTEMAEGFFANGVVIVEGRSDKAALTAVARLMGISFEAAGIAILSAEGKENLDRPMVVFRELGIPTFVVWDCDTGVKNSKPATNLALLRLARPDLEATETPDTDGIGDCYAHFKVTLETNIKSELGEALHEECLSAACEPFGITPSKDAHKIPEVMYQTLSRARAQGAECTILVDLVKAIWRHLRHEELVYPPVVAQQ